MLDKICAIADTLGAYAKEKGVTLCFHPHYGTCVFWESDIDYLMAHTDPRYVSFCIDKMGTFRALGHGTIDFPAVKAALEEIGYDGILCVELDRPEVGNFHSAEVSRIYIRDVLDI